MTIPALPDLLLTNYLAPTANGTRFSLCIKLVAPIPGPLKRPMCSALMKMMKVEQNYKNLARVIAEAPKEPAIEMIEKELA